MIVTVGMRTTLIDLLDRGRGSTASTFLVRMRVANKVVDAPAVAARYRSRISWWVVTPLDPGRGGGDGGSALMVSDVGGDAIGLSMGQGAFRMISMRYHIVSLAAVFLALALGIVLGRHRSRLLMTSLQSDKETLRTRRTRTSRAGVRG